MSLDNNKNQRAFRFILLIACVTVLGVSASKLLDRWAETDRGEKSIQQAVKMAGAPTPQDAPHYTPDTPAADIPEIEPDVQMLLDMDLDALKTVNEDVIGWIYVPDTEISYPIVQGESNQTYLRTSWDLQANSAGSIFSDARNSRDFCDPNTVLYGHHMRNGTMFAALHSFLEGGFAEYHLAAYVRTGDDVRAYQLLCAFETEKTSRAYDVSIDGTEYEDHREWCLSQSSVRPVSANSEYDGLLTLSTCGSDPTVNRVVVVYELTHVYGLPR